VISDSSSDTIHISASNQTCSRRGRPPRKLHSKVDVDSSLLLPIDEYNVGPVLEKLLAMMQSMSMLLSALKNDLRHSNMPEVVAKKRDAATTQLWRAFVAYQKSFSEIEQFACLSKNCGQRRTKCAVEPVHVSSQSRVRRGASVKRTSECLQARETEVIELSESESDEDVGCKRPHYDAVPSVPASEATATPATVLDNPSSNLEPSSSDTSLAPAASASYTVVDTLSDTSASCACVDNVSASGME